jgi:mannan endo-1,4-beta-mannosidase
MLLTVGKYGYPPLSFTNEIARHIKSLAPNHLVIDGTDGFWNYTTREIAPGVNSSFVDIMSDHLCVLSDGAQSIE